MKYRLGSIGCGNMGGAILRGAADNGVFAAKDIAVCVRTEETALRCRSAGYAVLSTAAEVYAQSEFVLLAIKPQGIPDLFTRLKEIDQTVSPVVISIVAGLTEAKIHASLPHARTVLVMPNTPLMLGCGATAISRGEGVTDAEFTNVKNLFSSLGEVREARAELQNEMIPLNGSSPAFVYYMIESLARWGEEQGVPYGDALILAAKTFEGAARMVLSGEDDPKTLIRKVCSPGGATLEGMKILDERQVNKILGEVADACVKRAYELGK